MDRTEFMLNRKALFGVMVLAAAGAMPAHAATITVDPTAADAAVAGDGKCSLRAGTYNLAVTGLDEGWVASTGAEPYVETNTPDATKGDLDILKSVRIVG